MRSAVAIFLISVIAQFSPARAANEQIQFDIRLSPSLSAYADTFLESPAYAVLALQNAGVTISASQPVTILSRESFQVGLAKVSYLQKKKKTYFYKASIELGMGKEISFPVEIDGSDIDKGFLKIRVISALEKLIPEEMTMRIESKLQMVSNEYAQKQYVAYLAEKNVGKLTNLNEVSKLFDAIAFDTYNNAGRIQQVIKGSQNERPIGAAEPLSEQVSLIFAILIWLIGFPIFLFIIRRQRLELTTQSK